MIPIHEHEDAARVDLSGRPYRGALGAASTPSTSPPEFDHLSAPAALNGVRPVCPRAPHLSPTAPSDASPKHDPRPRRGPGTAPGTPLSPAKRTPEIQRTIPRHSGPRAPPWPRADQTAPARSCNGHDDNPRRPPAEPRQSPGWRPPPGKRATPKRQIICKMLSKFARDSFPRGIEKKRTLPKV